MMKRNSIQFLVCLTLLLFCGAIYADLVAPAITISGDQGGIELSPVALSPGAATTFKTWGPRKLLGIEPHLYAFYDQPELLEEINADLLAYYQRVLPQLFDIVTPDILLIAEDLSYNHGPMLSKSSFDRVMAPYYKVLTKLLKSYGVHPMMDSDGDITQVIPWLYEVGAEGLGTLERMAEVDVVKISQQYPDILLLGGFDKTTMLSGEAGMRLEFERLLPVIKSGGYLLTVDHQTPQECSLSNYQLYRKLFLEYAAF